MTTIELINYEICRVFLNDFIMHDIIFGCDSYRLIKNISKPCIKKGGEYESILFLNNKPFKTKYFLENKI